MRAPFIRLAKEGDVLAKDCYLGPAGFGAEMPDQIDSAKVLAQFAAGATIGLPGTQCMIGIMSSGDGGMTGYAEIRVTC